MDGGSRDPSAGRDKALAGREASMDGKRALPSAEVGGSWSGHRHCLGITAALRRLHPRRARRRVSVDRCVREAKNDDPTPRGPPLPGAPPAGPRPVPGGAGRGRPGARRSRLRPALALGRQGRPRLPRPAPRPRDRRPALPRPRPGLPEHGQRRERLGVQDHRRRPPKTLASFALLPTGNKGQFAACAAGRFDGYWRQIGAALEAAAGATKTVFVEPGWEANLGSSVHPWGVDDVSQVPAYRACFRHAAAALRTAFPDAVIMWSSSKRYFKNYTVDQMNPGDQYFDHYGLLYYDN